MSSESSIGKRVRRKTGRSGALPQDASRVDKPYGKAGALTGRIAADKQRWLDPLMLLAVVLLLSLVAFRLLPWYTLSDEGFNWSQFEIYYSGRFGLSEALTMFPGYHYAVYLISKLFSFSEPSEVRYASYPLSILALLFFFLIVRKYDKSTSCPLSLQLFLCPLIFQFFFLIYTDVPALTMVLAGVWLFTIKRYQMAALVVGISLLVRQSNAVWLAMLWILSLIETGFFDPASARRGLFRHWMACLGRTWLYAVFCLAFAAFVFINGGIAIGDAGSHRSGFYPTQVFLLLFTLFFLFIPLHIANFRKVLSLLKSDPVWPFLGVILYAFYIFTFYADHGYNEPTHYFLRNMLLAEIKDAGLLGKTLAFIPMITAFYSLMVTPLKQRSYYWLYPFAVASLITVELIEQRYFIVPIALFMLFRKPLSRNFEYLQAALYVPFTVYVFEGTARNLFFL